MKNRDLFSSRKELLIKYLIIALFSIVYFFLIGQFGPIITRDSNAFINETKLVSQGYAVYHYFLNICKVCFGDSDFLVWATIIQCLMSIGVCLMVCEWISRRYNLNAAMSIMVYVMACSTFGYSLVEAVSCHYIMTESISFPVFYLYYLFFVEYRLNSDRKKKTIYSIIAFLLAVVLSLTRPQLLILPVATVLLVIWDIVWLKIDKHKIQVVGTLLLMVLVLFMGRNIASGMIKNGMVTSQMIDALGGRTLILAQERDRYFFSEETRSIFDFVYSRVSESGHVKENLRNNTWRGYDIGIHTNENTKLFSRTIFEYYDIKYGEKVSKNNVALRMRVYEVKQEIIAELLYIHWWEYLKMTTDLIIQSLVASSFIQPDRFHELCYGLTALIYLFYFATYLYARKKHVDSGILECTHITVYLLSVIVVVTNLFFYGQQRYVVYTFGFFYISWTLNLIGIKRELNDVQTT